MTSHTKQFIELSDIVGLQLECKKCGISLLAGGETLTATLVESHNTTLSQCPTCNSPWTVPATIPTQMGYDTEVKKFLRLIEEIRRIEKHIGCRIRFEIKEDVSVTQTSHASNAKG